jgi:signal transduction histidine kinase
MDVATAMRLPSFSEVTAPLRPMPAGAEDERAFAGSVGPTVLRYGVACALLMNALHLAFWPTDRVLLDPSAGVVEAVGWFRATTFVNHAVFLAAMRAAALRPHAVPLFALCALVSAGLLGAALARMGPLDAPYFHMAYLVPLATCAVPLTFARRALATLALGAAVPASYLTARPAELASTFLGASLGCTAFSVCVSLALGHLLYLLTRRAFLQERALQRGAEALAEHRDRLEERVAAQTAQIRELAAHVERATEDERARLSRELHDELGQQLTALRYTLAAARGRVADDPARARSRIEESEGILAHLAGVVRHMVTDLRPQVLDERGLGAAVSWLCEQTAARTGVPCDVEVRADPAVTLDPRVAIAAYRVAQESLTNAAKHAGATRLTVAVSVDAARVRVSVADDGAGFDATRAPRGGMGVFGMRERARIHGGTLAVVSAPGAGTAVTLELPRPSERTP